MAIRAPLTARQEPAEAVSPRAVDIEELWEHRRALADLSRRIVGDAATAEDVVQDTYLRALRNLDRIERRPSLIPWLTTVAKRRSIDMLRDRQRVAPVDETPDAPARAEFDPLVRALAGDTVDRVRSALSTLNEREQRLLSLQVDAGLSLEELADDEGASVDSVRSVLARARAKLKTALADSGVAAALPLGLLGRWMRRVRARMTNVGARAQQAPAPLTASLERLTDLVAAGAVTLALGAGPSVPAVALVNQPAAGTLPSPPAALTAPETSPPLSATGSGPQGPGDADGAPEVPPAGTTALAPVTASIPTGIVPPASDNADGPEDVGADSVAVGGTTGSDPVIVLAGTRLRGCTTDCAVLLMSEDGGGTWHRLAASGITGTSITLAPGFPSDPRILASGRQGVSISRDGGVTFARIAGPAVGAPIALSPDFSSGDDRALIGTAPAWIYDDGSGTTTPFAAPAVSAPTYFAFDPAYATSGRLFMAAGGAVTPEGTGAALYRCTARGGNDVCDEQAALPGLTTISGVHVAGPDGLVVWGGATALVSRDGGKSFAAAAKPAGAWITNVAGGGGGTLFASASGGAASESGTGGVLRSADGGANWTPLPVPESLAHRAGAVAVLPSGRLLAAPSASAGGGLWCSDDGGTTWGGCET